MRTEFNDIKELTEQYINALNEAELCAIKLFYAKSILFANKCNTAIANNKIVQLRYHKKEYRICEVSPYYPTDKDKIDLSRIIPTKVKVKYINTKDVEKYLVVYYTDINIIEK